MTEAKQVQELQKHAPALYGIGGFKLIKGAIFLALAMGIYSLSDNNLPEEFKELVRWFNLDPERQFFARIAEKMGRITASNVLMVAAGTMGYALLALVEGVGLMLRYSWAGWLAIGESAVFIPIEVWELSKRFTWGLMTFLALNIFICWYLFTRRHKLFRHHFSRPSS